MLTKNALAKRLGRSFKPAAYCCLALLGNFANAASALESPLYRFSGFATLGAVYNDSDEVDFVRDLSQPSGPRGEWSTLPDTILGGQVNIQPHEHWEAVFQLVSRYDYTNNYDPRLTWAFLKYEPDPAFAFRMGRIGYDAYMQGDSRNVGYSFLTVRQPIEYFGTLELTYFDGVDAVYKRPVGSGLLLAKLFAGVLDEKVPGSSGDYDLDNSKVLGGYLAYEWWNWQVRGGATTTELKNTNAELAPLLAGLRAFGGPAGSDLADDLALASSRITNWNIGIGYKRGALQGHLFYNHRQVDTRSLADADSVYALLAYRLSRLTPYVGYAQTDAKSTRVSIGQPFDTVLDPLFRGALLEQRSWLLGARYDFAQNLDVKFQLDLVDTSDPQGGFFRNAAPGWDGEALIFSVSLDAVF